MKISVKGIALSLSFPLAAALSIVLVADRSLTAFCAVINAVLHELGHIIILGACGCRVKSIKLSLFDISIKKSSCFLSINKEIAVALSGAAANILCVMLFYILYRLFDIGIFRLLSLSAAALACFNLLPVESLDGGRALTLLMMKRLSPELSLKIVRIISVAVLIPMLTFGLLLVIKSRYNFTLLFTSVYLTGIILLKTKSDYCLT